VCTSSASRHDAEGLYLIEIRRYRINILLFDFAGFVNRLNPHFKQHGPPLSGAEICVASCDGVWFCSCGTCFGSFPPLLF